MATASTHPIRVYADTSVHGGVFDAHFTEASREFFDLVRRARFRLVISALVRAEVEQAPEQVKKLFADYQRLAEVVELTEESIRLHRPT